MNTLTSIKKIHFVGIKGVAMTALAIYAKQAGYEVTGSDLPEEFPTDSCLSQVQIIPFVRFSADHISQSKPDLVIYTGAHEGVQNVEVQESIKQGICVLPHGKALGEFMLGKRQIAVAGSHGKTTTASMIATILTHAGFDPSFAIGCGEIRGLGLPGHFGKGEWFIAEADEYMTDPGADKMPRFLWLQPEILVVTNIDFDHPDAYASLDDVIEAFVKLRNKLPRYGEVIYSSDDIASKSLQWEKSSVTRVGKHADVSITQTQTDNGQTVFTIQSRDATDEYVLKIPGSHNIMNAAMAITASIQAGASREYIHEALIQFGGAKRRMEKIDERNGIIYYDDYAHHPREIEATLRGMRTWVSEKNICAVFQPHTYSRTKALLRDFSKAFHDADTVIITDIYASARESSLPGVTGETLYNEINKQGVTCYYAKTKDDVKEQLKKIVKPNGIVIFMGAGDIYNWEKDVLI